MWYLDTDQEISINEDVYSPSNALFRTTTDIDLPAKLADGKNRGVCLFGTVPPRSNLTMDRVQQYAEKLAGTIKKLNPDGVIVYEIQEEEGRDGHERPFAFATTHPPRLFAKMLNELAHVESIVYRTVAYHAKDGFDQWLNETWDEYNAKALVLVGGSTSNMQYPGYTVTEAAEALRDHPYNFLAGGIVLPERHRDKQDEHERLLQKTESGISFFTSQVVYNVDVAIWLLRDYDELCKEKGVKPARLIFTFAPFGRADTCTFLKWLGVEIPLGTEKRVLSRKTREAAINESVDICRENLKRILYAIEFYDISVPIGITVETVSKYSDEFNGSLKLFKVLQQEMGSFFSVRKLRSS
jgi:5,10-methylenetetrahydrofolate reductase